jgi:5-methylcytosine-specific restriction endonuclease McrA
MRAGTERVESCQNCGSPIPSGRKRNCSDRCRKAAWRARRKADLPGYYRRWRAAHRERARETSRGSRLRHLERARVREQNWSRQNRHRKLLHQANRRALLDGAAGSFTLAEWTQLCYEHMYACAYCGAWAPLTVDHKTPLKRGGTNYIGNILPACRPCNSRKGTRTESEFRALLERERQVSSLT